MTSIPQDVVRPAPIYLQFGQSVGGCDLRSLGGFEHRHGWHDDEALHDGNAGFDDAAGEYQIPVAAVFGLGPVGAIEGRCARIDYLVVLRADDPRHDAPHNPAAGTIVPNVRNYDKEKSRCVAVDETPQLTFQASRIQR